MRISDWSSDVCSSDLLADLSSSFGPQHPRGLSARAEIAGIRSKLKQEMEHIIGGLRHEARTADARYQALRQNFDRLKSQMSGVNEKSIQQIGRASCREKVGK